MEKIFEVWHKKYLVYPWIRSDKSVETFLSIRQDTQVIAEIWRDKKGKISRELRR